MRLSTHSEATVEYILMQTKPNLIISTNQLIETLNIQNALNYKRNIFKCLFLLAIANITKLEKKEL